VELQLELELPTLLVNQHKVHPVVYSPGFSLAWVLVWLHQQVEEVTFLQF
jgi:hypothetical protein